MISKQWELINNGHGNGRKGSKEKSTATKFTQYQAHSGSSSSIGHYSGDRQHNDSSYLEPYRREDDVNVASQGYGGSRLEGNNRGQKYGQYGSDNVGLAPNNHSVDHHGRERDSNDQNNFNSNTTMMDYTHGRNRDPRSNQSYGSSSAEYNYTNTTNTNNKDYNHHHQSGYNDYNNHNYGTNHNNSDSNFHDNHSSYPSQQHERYNDMNTGSGMIMTPQPREQQSRDHYDNSRYQSEVDHYRDRHQVHHHDDYEESYYNLPQHKNTDAAVETHHNDPPYTENRRTFADAGKSNRNTSDNYHDPRVQEHGYHNRITYGHDYSTSEKMTTIHNNHTSRNDRYYTDKFHQHGYDYNGASMRGNKGGGPGRPVGYNNSYSSGIDVYSHTSSASLASTTPMWTPKNDLTASILTPKNLGASATSTFSSAPAAKKKSGAARNKAKNSISSVTLASFSSVGTTTANTHASSSTNPGALDNILSPALTQSKNIAMSFAETKKLVVGIAPSSSSATSTVATTTTTITLDENEPHLWVQNLPTRLTHSDLLQMVKLWNIDLIVQGARLRKNYRARLFKSSFSVREFEPGKRAIAERDELARNYAVKNDTSKRIEAKTENANTKQTNKKTHHQLPSAPLVLILFGPGEALIFAPKDDIVIGSSSGSTIADNIAPEKTTTPFTEWKSFFPDTNTSANVLKKQLREKRVKDAHHKIVHLFKSQLPLLRQFRLKFVKENFAKQFFITLKNWFLVHEWDIDHVQISDDGGKAVTLNVPSGPLWRLNNDTVGGEQHDDNLHRKILKSLHWVLRFSKEDVVNRGMVEQSLEKYEQGKAEQKLGHSVRSSSKSSSKKSDIGNPEKEQEQPVAAGNGNSN